MSFFFKSKKNTPPSGLPQATRNLKSADGAAPPVSSLSAMSGTAPPRPDFRVLTPVQNGALRETVSEKTSMDRSGSRLQTERDGLKLSKSPSPTDQKAGGRDRADSEPRSLPASRIAQPAPAPAQAVTPTARPAADLSPYPWSQRQLTYNAPGAYPFPRYGAAVNAVSSRDGVLYIMGGLINGSTVKGDLWTIEAGTTQLACYPVQTTAEGPGPRVGHASLLVGNAFIVFGGDTKTEETDLLDDTLYLLNTSTKQWSRAAPAGIRPPGRYGHTLNILGSKIYIFGGQVEGFFFNDLVAFDLNALQQASNKWEVLIQNTMDGGPPHGSAPPARTNHSMVTWNDRLYLFGGTDGVTWFNDVWAYEGRTNSWSQLECIGYIPTAREGHAAALVGDVMYIFGGRTEEGNDLGDLAAFKITSRRWYTFQNMGPSPSPRSGHSMTTINKTIVVLAGEPSSAPRDAGELSLAYFLDTTKIRYPVDSATPSATQPTEKTNGVKKVAERSGIPQSRNATPRQIEQTSARVTPDPTNGELGPASRLPRSAGPQTALPIPDTSAPPNQNGTFAPQVNGADRPSSPIVAEEARGFLQPRSAAETAPATSRLPNGVAQDEKSRTISPAMRTTSQQHVGRPSTDSIEAGIPRSSSRQKRAQQPVAAEQETPRGSLERVISNGRRTASKERLERDNPVDSGVGSSPAPVVQHDSLLKQLEAEKSKNAWYASELSLAQRAGYAPSRNNSTGDDNRTSTLVGDADRPLIEALLKMRGELQRMQQAMEAKAKSTAEQIAQVEKQRDAAINEATFAKARYAAHKGENGVYDVNGHHERSQELSKRLALAVLAQNDLKKQVDALTRERDAERRARLLAEDGIDTHQKRITEFDADRQRTGGELETLRAELHEAQKVAREESARAAEALAAHQLLTVDKGELSSKLETAMTQVNDHGSILGSLHQAVAASSDKAAHLETQLESERAARNQLEAKLIQLKSQHEERTAELETTSRQLRETEELAEKHANEANTHRSAVLEGLARIKTANETEKPLTDKRVLVLQEQVEAANAMVRTNQAAANTASEKLRRAEERIAGLEAYQEQTSREGLSIRKQMQAAMKEMRSLGEEKARLQAQLQSQQLETNAINVQHSALKDVLGERGINSTDIRKTRLADSPSSLNRHGSATPETPRLRDLHDQLESSHRAQEDLRARLDEVEDRDATTRKEYEEKLASLDNDHQAAAKYLRGTEKMLSKMKTELQRVKQQSNEYLEELERLRSKSVAANGTSDRSAPPGWDVERAQLHRDIAEAKGSLAASMTPLESKVSALQADLQARDTDLQQLRSGHAAAQSDLETMRTTHATSKTDIDRLRRENVALEERARDAESKVQMLLDQVETSVDNYRRQTADLSGMNNAAGLQEVAGSNAGHNRDLSVASSSNVAPHGGFNFSHGGISHTRDSSATGHESMYSAATSTSHTSGETETDDVSDGHVIGAFPLSRQSTFRPAPLDTGAHSNNASNTNLGSSSLAPAPMNATERNSQALSSLADELDGLRYRLSGRFDFEPLQTPTKITSTFHNPTGSTASTGGLAEWRRGLEKKAGGPVATANDDDEEEEEGGFYPGRLTAMSTGSRGNLRGAAKEDEGRPMTANTAVAS